MIKKAVIYLCILMLALTGCISEESSPSYIPALSISPVSKEPLTDENFKITKGDISIKPVKETLNSAYVELPVEISNNSPYSFTRYGTYNIYEEINEEFFLVDNNGDGMTEREEKPIEQINPGETVRRNIYLGKITDDDFYTRPGKYKAEIPVNEKYAITLEFEIVDDYIPLNTGISLHIDKEQYSVEDELPFSYTVKNNSDEPVSVTLAVHIAQYRDGKWHRLSKSKKYEEIYYHANMWSEKCASGNTKKCEFSLSLPEMIGERLSPGKYRLEKKLVSDWYFAEFEVI